MSVKRLGKGLEALIRSEKNQSKTQPKGSIVSPESIIKIKLKDIQPNPNQPRKNFDETSLNELAKSIEEKGLITPITVRKVENGYELIAGERRWRALKKTNKRTVVAYVINAKNDADMMEMALIENIQREDLNAIEESEAYAVLNTKYGMAHGVIAKAVGKKRVTISNALRLLKLPKEIKKSLRNGQISAGHARAILQAKNSSFMKKMWKTILKKDLSVRQAEGLIKEEKKFKNKRKKRLNRKNLQLISLENELIEVLGTKVKVKPSISGGKIEISYFSIDDLDRILDIIGS